MMSEHVCVFCSVVLQGKDLGGVLHDFKWNNEILLNVKYIH